MGRYDLPDPICQRRHTRTSGFVSYPPIGSPGFAAAGSPMASTRVCHRDDCIEDALAWVKATTGHLGTHTTDAELDAARTEGAAP